MGNTVSGGKLAAKTNKKRHGKDFYANIGRLGGLVRGVPGGFGSTCHCDWSSLEHARARCAGSIGGKISVRGKAKSKEQL